MQRDLEQLGEQIAEQAAHVDAAMHRLLTDLREFDRGGGWSAQGFRSCAHWMAWRLGWTLGTSREHVRVANSLEKLPVIQEALRTGEVSYSKVRAMTRVATPTNETTLVEQAQATTATQLETICRKYATVQRADEPTSPKHDADRRHVTRRALEDGMVRISAVLHAEEAALVWAALDRVAAERCREVRDVPAGTPADIGNHDQPRTPEMDASAAEGEAQFARLYAAVGCDPIPDDEPRPVADIRRVPAGTSGAPRQSLLQIEFSRADALVSMAQDIVRGTRKDRAAIEVLLTVDAATLRRPSAPPEDGAVPSVALFGDGTAVTGETARRLCCDAGVVELTEDAHGNPVSVGRKTRTIAGAVKRALLKRDPTCRYPGCTNRVFLEGHHIEHWADGGATGLANLVSLCSHHHRFVHEYSYSIELAPDGSPRFMDPQNRLVPNAPAPARPAVLGWDALLERHRDLGITPATNESRYDGERINWNLTVEALVRADGTTA